MLELFKDHLKVSDEFEIGDLDLQGQICHESSDVCGRPCECGNFYTCLNFTFKVELCYYQLKVLDEFKSGDLGCWVLACVRVYYHISVLNQ